MTDRCLDRLREENSLIWPMSALSPNSLPVSSALGPAWCHCRGSVLLRCPTGQGDELIVGVEDEVQLEAEEPAHLAALGQTGKNLVPAKAMIVARAVEPMS